MKNSVCTGSHTESGGGSVSKRSNSSGMYSLKSVQIILQSPLGDSSLSFLRLFAKMRALVAFHLSSKINPETPESDSHSSRGNPN